MFNKIMKIKLLLLIFSIILYVEGHFHKYNDYINHPCKRDCSDSSNSMECIYHFTVEWYDTMNEKCGNCPFNITDCFKKNCVAINGYKRAVLAVNRMVPGPSIEVCRGDTIVVNVENMARIIEGVGIHWHGLLQRHSQHMDGAGMITQCPIMHENTFQYRFPAVDVGTYWWHSHVYLQRTDGVFGPLIIRQNKRHEPHSKLYDYDLSAHVIIINDWFKEDFLIRAGPSISNINMKNADSIIINGKGAAVNFYDKKKKKIYNTPRAVFHVECGKRYRFRLISNALTSCPLTFSIEDHSLLVIATDAHSIEPVTVKSIVIHAGERYDFILNANKKPKNYVIKVIGESMCNTSETAILKYNSHSSYRHPTNLDGNEKYHFHDRNITLNPTDITNMTADQYIRIDKLKSKKTKENLAFLSKIKRTPNKKIFLNIEAIAKPNEEYPKERATFTFRNISSKMPPIPILFDWDLLPKKLVCNAYNKDLICPDKSKICSCIHVYELNLNDVVELIVVDLDEFKVFSDNSVHMIHLHGHTFAVLSAEELPKGTKLVDVQELDKKGKLKRNFNNPPIKDTTFVPTGYTIVRFVADNPGVWMFHCHTEFHLETGLALLFRVGNTEDLPIQKPYGWPECGTFNYNLINNISTE